MEFEGIRLLGNVSVIQENLIGTVFEQLKYLGMLFLH